MVAKRSTCNRLHVGAVISRDGRILSLGYNGPVAGAPHCQHDITPSPVTTAGGIDVLTTQQDGCLAAVHAEANAIAFAAREGVCVSGATLCVTHQPCLKCAQLIINSGVVKVTYHHPYRLNDGVELLTAHNVRCLPYFERLDN